MEVNRPDVLAEVSALFAEYESALVSNDVDVLNGLFWDDPRAVRFGVQENLYGFHAISAFRAERTPVSLGRRVLRSVITTYGTDFATTSIEFQRTGAERTGRQSQAWARTPAGWRIVAAHVSLLEAGAPP